MVFDGPRLLTVDGGCYNGATMLLWWLIILVAVLLSMYDLDYQSYMCTTT